MGLRERKRLATRQALGIAAMRLAIRHGLDGVRVEDIAEAVGVSPRTFNNYFGSKYEAITALSVDRGEELGLVLRARPAAEPLWTAILASVQQQYQFADTAPDPEWTRGVRLVTSSPALRGEHLKAQEQIRRSVGDAIAARLGVSGTDDMRPAIVASSVIIAVDTAVQRWLDADPPVPLAGLIATAFDQLITALGGLS